MYYYETLSSIDYRGSMTSLQSCQSAFSNISKAQDFHNNKHRRHCSTETDQHSMTSGISSGGVSRSTDECGNGHSTNYRGGGLGGEGSGEQSMSVIPAVTILPPTSPGTPTALLTMTGTPVSSSNVSSESTTLHNISERSSAEAINNPTTTKGNGWSEESNIQLSLRLLLLRRSFA